MHSSALQQATWGAALIGASFFGGCSDSAEPPVDRPTPPPGPHLRDDGPEWVGPIAPWQRYAKNPANKSALNELNQLRCELLGAWDMAEFRDKLQAFSAQHGSKLTPKGHRYLDDAISYARRGIWESEAPSMRDKAAHMLGWVADDLARQPEGDAQ